MSYTSSYHTRVSGLDGEKPQTAEKRVREWATAHILLFPEFSDDHRKQCLGTLDYPSVGSPGAERRRLASHYENA